MDNLEQTFIQLIEHPTRSWLPKSAYLDPALVRANMAGLALRSVMGFEVFWDGSNKPESLSVEIFEAPQSSFLEGYQRVFSCLGMGIFQVTMKSIIRSPQDVNLLVLKPINFVEQGYEVIPALIETDTYTNEISFAFRVTLPGKRIYIELGSILASLIPLPRYFVDNCQFSTSPKNPSSLAKYQFSQEETAELSQSKQNPYKFVHTAQSLGFHFMGEELFFTPREIFLKTPELTDKMIQLACPKKVHKYIHSCIRDTRCGKDTASGKDQSAKDTTTPTLREDLPQALAQSVPVAMACSHSIDIVAPFSFAVSWDLEQEKEPLSIELDLEDPLCEKNILNIFSNFKDGIFSCVFAFSLFTHKSTRLLLTSPLCGAIKGLTTLSRILESHSNTEELVVHLKVSSPKLGFIKVQKGQALASCIPIPADYVSHFAPYFDNAALDKTDMVRIQKQVQIHKKNQTNKPFLIANPDQDYTAHCQQNPLVEEK